MGYPLSRSLQVPILLVALALAFVTPGHSRDRKDTVQYGTGLIVNIPASGDEVEKAVQEVVENGIIRGSKEYNKDEYITGATTTQNSTLFPSWTEGGKVFYKVRLHVLDPRNFKDSGDVGTLAVRYVVLNQDDKHTVLRIDAIFVEDFRHAAHASNGSVEGAEYKDIHDHIESLELMKQETADAEKEKAEATRKKFIATNSDQNVQPPTPGESAADLAPTATASEDDTDNSEETLEQRVQKLRREAERLVKAPGAPLKSAPFHSASNLQSLTAGTEVLIVISTPYWFGVETHDGHHGWILRDDLEELP